MEPLRPHRQPERDRKLPRPRYDASQAATSFYLSENIPFLSLLKDSTVSQQHSCDFFLPFIAF